MNTKARHGSCIVALGSVSLGLASGALAQADGAPSRQLEIPVTIENIPTMHVVIGGDPTNPRPVLRGPDCSNVVTHSAADFTGGVFTVQGGFSENETAAAGWNVAPGDFPIQIESAECIFATQNPVGIIEVEWSVIFYDGSADTGTVVETFSSDGVILPHITLSPAMPGVNVMVSIDPSDPDQVFINNTSGQNRFSVGFRVDQMNVPFNGCTATAGDGHVQVNAFPTTDNTSPPTGVSNPALNWIDPINCGILGCPLGSPGAWYSFSSGGIGLCAPNGDWNIRATWKTPGCTPGAAACCLPNGQCIDTLAPDCESLGGTFSPGEICAGFDCSALPGACCFEGAGCLNLDETSCIGAGGFYQGAGTTCAETICFPMGACCLPDGTCQGPLSPEDCTALSGVFQGDATDCASTECPQPIGSCCFPTGFCLELTEDQCSQGGGTWTIGATCEDLNGNSEPDVCEAPVSCACDWNGDGGLNDQDFFDWVNDFFSGAGPQGQSDFNEDTFENDQDWFDFTNCFFNPPAGC